MAGDAGFAALHFLTTDAARARALGSALGLSPTVAQVLIHRGYGEVEAASAFLEPSLAGLTAPTSMCDRDLATERIVRAVRAGERIVVFGDYDVDGTTSTAILTHLLRTLRADVTPVLASRFAGGYGLSDEGLARCLAHRPSLLITCDCGSSDHARIERAKAAGVSVVVIDHHLVPSEALPADAFLNPHRPDCAFAYKGLCSAGLAFSVGAAVRSVLAPALDMRAYLDLVAIGTIADVAPLDGDNRRLVRAGLARFTRGECRPGVAALLEVGGFRTDTAVGARDVAFKLAPRLNAPGRLGDPAAAFELLMATDAAEARRRASAVESANEERKRIEATVTAEALADVARYAGEKATHPVVAFGEGWHRGVVGITAARLVDRHHVPAVVVAVEDGMGHGSARSFGGVDVHAMLSSVRHLFEGFGGHAAAAGFGIRAAKLPELREALREVRIEAGASDARTDVDLRLGPDFPLPRASELSRLEPMGQGNGPIRVSMEARVTSSRTVGTRGSRQLQLAGAFGSLRAFVGPQARVLREPKGDVTVVGLLTPDSYRGEEAVQVEAEIVG